MANTKLDMGVAWTTATGLIGANKDTISAIAGLFFFLPSFAAALFIGARLFWKAGLRRYGGASA